MSVQQSSDTHHVTVFYPRRKNVLVTDEWFCAHGRRYFVGNLAKLDWRSGSMQFGRWVALEMIAIETALVTVIVLAAGPSPLALLVTGLYLLVAGASLWFSVYRWPTPLHLLADYRNVPTILHTSTDHLEFHKIFRALRRAAEQHELAP
jgi:hypothetical protein